MGDTREWDALVVGVDAAGTVTGSAPLGADWGEIVVGEAGTVLATSMVNYWTGPSSGGVPKSHVAMIEPLTPDGNQAAAHQDDLFRLRLLRLRGECSRGPWRISP